MKKAQLTIIEGILAVSLLAFSFGYVYVNLADSQHFEKQQLDSALYLISQNESMRIIIMSEELNVSSQSQNWGSITTSLNQLFSSYELRISNLTTSEVITNCDPNFQKIFSQRLITISNSTEYELRSLELGVCA